MTASVTNHNINDIVSIKMGVSRREAAEFYETFKSVMLSEIAAGNDVVLNGLMRIEHVDREARKGRNPRTGETVEVGPKTVVKVRNRSELHNWRVADQVELTQAQADEISEYREKRMADVNYVEYAIVEAPADEAAEEAADAEGSSE